MAEITITNRNFESEVLQSDKPVLVDFWAAWCGPCKMLWPIVAQIAEEHPEIKVGKVNVDEEPELANRFGVMSIPTVVVFKEGRAVQTSVGVLPKGELLKMLQA